MTASNAKSFAFPARSQIDLFEREASHARSAQLDSALNAAAVTGYAEGLVRGREEAKAEAREALENSCREGIAQGHEAGLAAMNTAADAMREALGACDLERAQVAAEAEAFCVDLALAIVERLIEADKARAEFIRRATQAALKALAPAAPTAVFLNPADLKRIGKAIGDLPLREDQTLAPGTSRVETGRLLVESSLDEAFAQVRCAVLEIKLKRTGQKPPAEQTQEEALDAV
jgi:flagellar biosynthesis/type III secretory pathway protein FliH